MSAYCLWMEKGHEIRFSGHHRDSMYTGVGSIQIVSGGGRRHRRRRHRKDKSSKDEPTMEAGQNGPAKSQLPPSQRIAFLLDEEEVEPKERSVFTEMEELHGVGDGQQWREVAR